MKDNVHVTWSLSGRQKEIMKFVGGNTKILQENPAKYLTEIASHWNYLVYLESIVGCTFILS